METESESGSSDHDQGENSGQPLSEISQSDHEDEDNKLDAFDLPQFRHFRVTPSVASHASYSDPTPEQAGSGNTDSDETESDIEVTSKRVVRPLPAYSSESESEDGVDLRHDPDDSELDSNSRIGRTCDHTVTSR